MNIGGKKGSVTSADGHSATVQYENHVESYDLSPEMGGVFKEAFRTGKTVDVTCDDRGLVSVGQFTVKMVPPVAPVVPVVPVVPEPTPKKRRK